MKGRGIVYFVLLICSWACQQASINSVSISFDEPYVWKRGESKVLVLEVTENSEPCELILDVRYALPLMGFEKIQLHIVETQPTGVTIPRDVTIELKDKEGGLLGDASGDLVDVERVLDSNKQYLRHGKYTYTITHNMPTDILGGVMELRIRTMKKKESKS
jgi:gliding motility-associated lipoprotein GldH